jgi:hypothetical protein
MKYLAPGTPTYVPRKGASAAEAISVIKNAGGVPVLAHPLRYGMDIRQTEQMVAALQTEGLLGIECYYSSHSQFEQDSLLRLAKKYRLYSSGGSDFHGGFDGLDLGTGYGGLFVPMLVYDGLRAISSQAAARPRR